MILDSSPTRKSSRLQTTTSKRQKKAGRFRFILDTLDGDYDYIFEVLCADILEGDLKAPERPRIPQNASVFRDDIYRVF